MKTTTLMMILAAAVASSSPASASMPTVGIMYEGWHAPAVQAIEDCAGCAPPLTIEAVLRSNGTKSLADAYATVNASISQAFHFHTEPLHGSFYCMYRKRASDAHGATGLRDCRGIPATAARHAALLRAANISFVVADSTNIQSDCEFGDAIQLRPFEVLAEEWHALRLRGLPTPQIAIWQNLQDRRASCGGASSTAAPSTPTPRTAAAPAARTCCCATGARGGPRSSRRRIQTPRSWRSWRTRRARTTSRRR